MSLKQPLPTLALLVVIVADSVITAIVGVEASPVALKIMAWTGLSLNGFLVGRVIVGAVCAFMLDQLFNTLYVLIAYTILYTIGAILAAVLYTIGG